MSASKTLWQGVAGLLALTFSAVLGAAQPPHIVIILLDDMGYGDPSVYNPQSRIPTPHIDRLAGEGMRFTDAHAAGPLCHVSRYGLMTGQYPFRANPESWATRATIDADQTTLPSFLQAHGYHTAMVGKWHLGFDEAGYDDPLPGGPVDRGFDLFFGIRASTDIPPYFYIRDDRAVTPPTAFINAGSSAGWAPIQGAFWRAGAIAPNLELNEVLPRFTREATDVIRRHAAQRPDQPLFLYLALSSPHTPWLPSGEFSGKSGAGMYGDFTMMTDAMVGRVLDTLDATGMAPATLVILSSDNGPVWYERDVDRFGHDSAGPWRGMKGDVWEAGHRVPFIVRWPGRVEPGSSSAQLISFVDVLPTLAAVLGQPLPRGAAPDGKSFHYALTGTVASAHQARTSLIVAARNGTLSYRQGHWKYIAGLGSGGLSPPARRDPAPGEPPVQLYHLERDPAERNNLSKDHPGLVRELERQLAKRLRTD